jgi:hypothetical protein
LTAETHDTLEASATDMVAVLIILLATALVRILGTLIERAPYILAG